MNSKDYKDFSENWICAHERSAGGKSISDSAVSFDFELLSDFDLSVIKKAISQHCKSSKFSPTVADIIEIIEPKRDQFISADEAWSLCPRNEDETIRWTEITGKAYVIASELRSHGDEIAARMAFKAAYQRICEEYKHQGMHDKWVVCLGNDKLQRVYALEKFVQLGFCSPEFAQNKAPDAIFNFTPKLPQIAEDRKNIKALRKIAEALVGIKTESNTGYILDSVERKSRTERVAINAEYEAQFEQKRKIAIESLGECSRFSEQKLND